MCHKNQSWLSAHLFLDGSVYSAACDRIIKKVVQPFIEECLREQWITRYFFIRYSEYGSHLRVRVYGENAVLEDSVKKALISCVKESFPEELAASPVFNEQPPREYERVTSQLYWAPYEPEYDRYGGIAGVELAERFFNTSSQMSMEMLNQIEGKGESARQGKGLIATLILTYAFIQDSQQLSQFHSSYCTTYLKNWIKYDALSGVLQQYEHHFEEQKEVLFPFMQAIIAALDGGESLPGTPGAFYKEFQAIRDECIFLFEEKRLELKKKEIVGWEASMQSLLRSYVHMTNNRLGLSIPDETYLAYIISRSISNLHALSTQ